MARLPKERKWTPWGKRFPGSVGWMVDGSGLQSQAYEEIIGKGTSEEKRSVLKVKYRGKCPSCHTLVTGPAKDLRTAAERAFGVKMEDHQKRYHKNHSK